MKSVEFIFFSFCFLKSLFRLCLTSRKVLTVPGCSGSCRSDPDDVLGHKLHFMLSEQLNKANHCVYVRMPPQT